MYVLLFHKCCGPLSNMYLVRRIIVNLQRGLGELSEVLTAVRDNNTGVQS